MPYESLGRPKLVTRDDLSIGQRVFLHKSWHRKDQAPLIGEIVAIKKKYVHIAEVYAAGTEQEKVSSRPDEFDIETQQQKGQGSHSSFRTEAQETYNKRMRAVREYLRRVGIDFRGQSRITEEDQERIAKFVRELGYETGTWTPEDPAAW